MLTSIVLDISLGIAWWITKKIASQAVSTLTYMIMPA